MNSIKIYYQNGDIRRLNMEKVTRENVINVALSFLKKVEVNLVNLFYMDNEKEWCQIDSNL